MAIAKEDKIVRGADISVIGAEVKAKLGVERTYNEQAPNGKGYTIIQKNDSLSTKMTKSNTIYEIRYDHDLNNGTLILPANSTLYFVGGKIYNGSITCSNTSFDGDVKIDASLTGTTAHKKLYSSWFSNITQSVSNAKALGCNICIDTSATLDAPLSLFGIREVEITGTITNSETNYLEVGYSSSQAVPTTIDIWDCTYIRMTGGKNAFVSIRNCDYLILEADNTVSGKGALAYCTFMLGFIRNLSIIGHNNGWINENTFIKGRIYSTLTIRGDTYSHNNNVFYNPTLENVTVTIDKAMYNIFHDCRFEGSNSVSFGSYAYNNKFYRSWLNTNESLMRQNYISSTHNGNGIFYETSIIQKQFTINKDTYINHRALDYISICDDERSLRLETSSAYAAINVWPKTNFGLNVISDGYGLSRFRVRLYDNEGVNLPDTLTSYIISLGTFTRNATDPNDVYYTLNRDDYINILEIKVDKINDYLKTTYGLDEQDQPLKWLGKVKIELIPNNVRKRFSYIDIRISHSSGVNDNANIYLEQKYWRPQNISTSTPTKVSTISGNAVPYSIIDGEDCFCTSNNTLYKRIGDTIYSMLTIASS